MAYVNVMEWKAEQVAEWLRGLDDVVYPYAHFFLNNDVTGQGLLNLTVDDLYKLHVEKLGHQEIILESLDLLRNFHFHLDQENLQFVCLRLSCKARSLYHEIMARYPESGKKQQEVSAPMMSAVADVLDTVRLLLSWLDRRPFDSKGEFHRVRTTLISLSLELATNAQRDTFAEQPVDVIRSCCDKLGQVADRVIQDMTDPLILQPASLDVATIRKRTEEEIGVVLEAGQQHGVHLVVEVNMLNPSARIQPGDEIVQVNYQTVVGWQTKKVQQLMGENPGEVILTLKKRPKHSALGQLYIKPFRIPARKKSAYYINNLPSPRTELLVVPDLSRPIVKRSTSSNNTKQQAATVAQRPSDDYLDDGVDGDSGGIVQNSDDSSGDDSEDDEAFLPVAASQIQGQFERSNSNKTASPTASLRSVLSRPRSAPQRRATISGISHTQFRPYINVSEIWPGTAASHKDNDDLDNNDDITSLDNYNCSTLSSHDSGVSTLSAQDIDAVLLRRRRLNQAHQRPQTAPSGGASHMPHVVSAPSLHSSAVLSGGKAPLPDPPGEAEETKLNEETPAVVSSVAAIAGVVYMNVVDCHQAEYVNMTPDLVTLGNKNPLPKPRIAKSSLTLADGGGRTGDLPTSPAVSVVHRPPPAAASVPSSPSSESATATKGRRPVPLPRRRLSSAANPPSSTTSQDGGSLVRASPLGLSAETSASTGSSSINCTKSPPPQSPSRRKPSSSAGGGAGAPDQFPTPTAQFKSYRRATVVADPTVRSSLPSPATTGCSPTVGRGTAVRRGSSGGGGIYSSAVDAQSGGVRALTTGSQAAPPASSVRPIARLSFDRLPTPPPLVVVHETSATSSRRLSSTSSTDSGRYSMLMSASPKSPQCPPPAARPLPGPPIAGSGRPDLPRRPPPPLSSKKI